MHRDIFIHMTRLLPLQELVDRRFAPVHRAANAEFKQRNAARKTALIYRCNSFYQSLSELSIPAASHKVPYWFRELDLVFGVISYVWDGLFFHEFVEECVLNGKVFKVMPDITISTFDYWHIYISYRKFVPVWNMFGSFAQIVRFS